MDRENTLSWEGVQLVWVVLGLFGAALGIGAMPPMTKKQCWTAMGSGLVFAGLGPQWVNYAYMFWTPAWLNSEHTALPSFMTGSTAFVCGVGGMFLVPGIIAFWRDPRAFVIALWEFIRLATRGPRPEDKQ